MNKYMELEWWVDDDGYIAAGYGDDYMTIANAHCSDIINPDDREKVAQAISAVPELITACAHLVSILNEEDEEFYNKHIEAFNMGINALKKAGL